MNMPRPPTRRGLTLVELVMASAVMALVLMAVHSAVRLAAAVGGSKAGSPTETATTAADIVDLMAADLAEATAVTGATATTLTLTVPDRTADGAAEMITYTYTPAIKTLTRDINGTSQTLTAAAGECALAYNTATVAGVAVNVAGPEVLLSGYDAPLLATATSVTSTAWPAQVIRPALPSDTVSWSVTRVGLRLRSKGTTVGQAMVQVRQAGTNTPGTKVLAQAMVSEAMLDSYFGGFRWFAMTGASGLAPTAGVAVVVQWVSDTASCDVEHQGLTALSLDSNMATSLDGGVTWTAQTTRDINYQLYGRLTRSTPQPATTVLTGVRVTVAVGTGRRIVTTAATPNRPVMP